MSTKYGPKVQALIDHLVKIGKGHEQKLLDGGFTAERMESLRQGKVDVTTVDAIKIAEITDTSATTLLNLQTEAQLETAGHVEKVASKPPVKRDAPAYSPSYTSSTAHTGQALSYKR
jgi:hypothetical protein